MDFIKTKRRILSDDVGGDATDENFSIKGAQESMLEDDESSWKEPEEG